MDLLQLGALCLAILAVLGVLAAAVKGFRWLMHIARRLEEVLERTDRMPHVEADVEQMQGDIAALTGQMAGVATQVQTAAMVAGRQGGLLAGLKADLDTLWNRHRELASRVSACETSS
jgi:hypothetical protein